MNHPLNRRLYAEWETKRAILLTWPHSNQDWTIPLEAIESEYGHFVRQLQRVVPVKIVAQDPAHVVHIQELGTFNPSLCEFYIHPTNDVWVRDNGPIAIEEAGTPILLDFNFNGWGQKYRFEKDNAMTLGLNAQGAFDDIQVRKINFVLEGGSLESNGQGTLLTTRSCVLDSLRNAGITESGLSDMLKEVLGVTQIHYLSEGALLGDDTDGHIDNLVRFADARTLLYASTDDPHHPNFHHLRRLAKELKGLTDIGGSPYHLVPIPMPKLTHCPATDRVLPASFLNFLPVNGAVFVPIFDQEPLDVLTEQALHRIQNHFKPFTIIPIPCAHLITQNGGLHCATMQIPA